MHVEERLQDRVEAHALGDALAVQRQGHGAAVPRLGKRVAPAASARRRAANEVDGLVADASLDMGGRRGAVRQPSHALVGAEQGAGDVHHADRGQRASVDEVGSQALQGGEGVGRVGREHCLGTAQGGAWAVAADLRGVRVEHEPAGESLTA